MKTRMQYDRGRSLQGVKRGLMKYRLLQARAMGAREAGDLTRANRLTELANLERAALIVRLEALEDERVRSVMSMRYLHGLPWDEIAEQMFFSLRWVMKLHKRGLCELMGG